MSKGRTRTLRIALIGGVIVAAILILGTFWMGQSAKRDTENAVHSVSLLYLDELAGRREQVVAGNLRANIDVIRIAIGLMTEDDLSDLAHLQGGLNAHLSKPVEPEVLFETLENLIR